MTLENLTLTAGRSSCVISRADLDDPTGKRRRHFDIINSAFIALNCRATQANRALPQCTGSANSCGYRDAQPLVHGPSGTTRPLTSSRGRYPWRQRAPPTLHEAVVKLLLGTGKVDVDANKRRCYAPPGAGTWPSSNYSGM